MYGYIGIQYCYAYILNSAARFIVCDEIRTSNSIMRVHLMRVRAANGINLFCFFQKRKHTTINNMLYVSINIKYYKIISVVPLIWYCEIDKGIEKTYIFSDEICLRYIQVSFIYLSLYLKLYISYISNFECDKVFS